ncbi:MAG: MoxR family ATPase [Phycisphaerales bacterium]|jgi:MoxR-like ATPase|nr:MoxR family ATPase [Phycisphaerales bacterium]
MSQPREIPGTDEVVEALRCDDPGRACTAFRETFARLRAEIGRVLVGQDDVVEEVLIALFSGGHVLLEGVPGLGKTLLVQTLGDTLTLDFTRIQFTPDLMPADITGTSIVTEDPASGQRSITFRRGPIFSQLVLADEINRASPKSQAALLEAMQERSVSAGGETHVLDRPFFVMATQNPIEQEGTYPLPEAQLDRFLLKVLVPYARRDELNEILRRTTSEVSTKASQVIDGETILAAQSLARRIVVAPLVKDYIVRLVLATHPDGPFQPESLKRVIAVGASPRAAQSLVLTAKVLAMIDGRYHASISDVVRMAAPVLRHRLVRTFEAETDGRSVEDIVETVIDSVPVDPERTDPLRLIPSALSGEERGP